MEYNIYWPHWWKLWPSWATNDEEAPDIIIKYFYFGPFQFRWYS